MNITADAVKQLRERTGAGMMECKKALVETKGDLDAAAELMRRQGLAKADKKATRVAAEGVVVAVKSADARTAAMVEINCETDFVARGPEFGAFAQSVAESALRERPASLPAIGELRPGGTGETLEERRRGLIAKIGENISIRRFTVLSAPEHLGVYVHGTRIGALVALKGGSAELARDLAMHVSWSNPRYLSPAHVPADEVAKERAILTEQAQGEGKPPEIITKMVEGRLRKALAEITLSGQPFVKDPDVTIEKLLKGAGAEVVAYERFEVGAGIEKKADDFVAGVMAQVKGSDGPVRH
jgi:elongation factor Ts